MKSFVFNVCLLFILSSITVFSFVPLYGADLDNIPLSPVASNSISKSIENEDNIALFENHKIRVNLGISGISSWFLKQYTEEFYNEKTTIPDLDKAPLLNSGLYFDSLLPQLSARYGLKPEGIVKWVEKEKCYLSTFNTVNSDYLPVGLEISMKWYFSNKYSGRLEVSVLNKENHPISLADTNGNPIILYTYPLFANDTIRTYVKLIKTNGNEPSEIESLSPDTGTPVEIKTSKAYIGATNQYYAFALRETTDSGSYLYTKRSITIKSTDGKTDKQITTPVVGWKFLWSKIRSKESLNASFEFFLGPKQEVLLKEAGYIELFDTWSGWTGPISKLVFSLLTLLYSVTGHYGYAIILLTLIVKIILHPLSRKQMVSMQKMQAIQPQMQKLKEEIKDPQKQQQAMQKLFVENDVNPVAGCLPLLFQLPIFIALYTCLSSAIELKNVSFLWLPDLSMPDPTYALPVLFAVGNYFTMQANSSGSEQMPAMKYMPVMMFFFFMNLASGVLIYFVGQSVFSFFEQKYNKAMMKDPLVVEATVTSIADDNSDKKKSQTKNKSCKKSKKKKK